MQLSSGEAGSNTSAPKCRNLTLADDAGAAMVCLRAATGINTHLAFYRWLQRDVARFLPHRTLLAAWGDFGEGRLRYDVTSRVPGLCTTALRDLAGLSEMVSMLHATMCKANSRYVVSRSVLEIVESIPLQRIAPGYREDLQHSVAALLAYRMHDERADCDVVYLFAITDPQWEPDPDLLDLIMPHIDTALRRVRCLEKQLSRATVAEESRLDLSAREREVMHWVSEGKSNEEIGTILGISHNTVKNHLKRIFGKLGVSARSQAVRVFMQESLGAA